MAVTGYNCTLTAGGNVVGKARDVELEGSATEVDITTRGGSGWKEFLQGLKEWSITVEQLWVPTDTAMQALITAWIAGTVLAVTMYDDDSKGFAGNVIVMSVSHGQPLDDAVSASVTLKGTGALTPSMGS